jgi:hypothetical protein
MLVMAVLTVTVWALVPDAELRVIVLFELTVTVLVAVALAQPPVPGTV